MRPGPEREEAAFPPAPEHCPAYDWLVYYTPVRSYPPLGDRKATAILAAVSLLVSVLLLFSRPLGRLVLGDRLPEAVAGWFLLALLTALLLIAGSSAFRALNVPIPPTPRSLAHFEHIAGGTREQYMEGVKGLTTSAAARALLHYNYSLALQSARKFHLLARAMAALHAAFALWLVAVTWAALRQ